MFKLKTGLTVLLLFVSLLLKANDQIEINSSKKQLKAPEFSSYQWFFNGKELANENNRELSIEASGVYRVVMKNHNGTTQSQLIMVSVESGKVRKIILIGDSTCSNYDDDVYPRTGWGQVFQSFFNKDSVVVGNYALSGRSSKSFHTDANGWPQAKNQLGEGDFLFIQFGHNDAKTDEERHTDPFTTFQDYLSIYIDYALSVGAHPVLLTSIERNGWSGTSLSYSHGDYPEAMRELAVEKDIPLIDLTEKTHERWEVIGEDYVTNNIYMNIPTGMYATYPDGRGDNTHLQEEGAWEVSKLVKQAIEEQKDTTTLGLLANNTHITGFVKALADPYLKGTFTGTGVIPEGSTTEVKAKPVSGYAIAGWKLNDELVSEERTYTYTAADTMIFLRGVFDVGYSILLYRTQGGTTQGAGAYLDGTNVTVYASPYDGYEFKGWVDANADTVETDTAMTVTVDGEVLRFKAIFSEIPSDFSEIEKNEIKLFPNPVKEALNFSSDILINSARIYSTNGKKLFHQEIGDTYASLKLSLEKGIYILKLSSDDDQIFTRTFYIE